MDEIEKKIKGKKKKLKENGQDWISRLNKIK